MRHLCHLVNRGGIKLVNRALNSVFTTSAPYFFFSAQCDCRLHDAATNEGRAGVMGQTAIKHVSSFAGIKNYILRASTEVFRFNFSSPSCSPPTWEDICVGEINLLAIRAEISRFLIMWRRERRADAAERAYSCTQWGQHVTPLRCWAQTFRRALGEALRTIWLNP